MAEARVSYARKPQVAPTYPRQRCPEEGQSGTSRTLDLKSIAQPMLLVPATDEASWWGLGAGWVDMWPPKDGISGQDQGLRPGGPRPRSCHYLEMSSLFWNFQLLSRYKQSLSETVNSVQRGEPPTRRTGPIGSGI